MKNENMIAGKSMVLSIRIVNLYKYLIENRSEYVLSKQVLRSGTNIGANVRESVCAQSRARFIVLKNIDAGAVQKYVGRL